jgi:hypothetical protein
MLFSSRNQRHRDDILLWGETILYDLAYAN